MAALLAFGPGAALSHRTAAALWGLWRSTTAVEVSACTRNGRDRSGIVLHRVRLMQADVTEHEGFPVTTPARTLLDLASVLPSRAVAHAVEAAERARIFDLAAIDALFARYPRRAGTKALRTAISLHRPRTELTRSDLERLFLALCGEHALEGPCVNVPVGPYVVDFLWPRQRLIVETDGAKTHMTRAAFERDRLRDGHLTAAGFRVVRFTYHRVTEEPEAVARTLCALLHN